MLQFMWEWVKLGLARLPAYQYLLSMVHQLKVLCLTHAFNPRIRASSRKIKTVKDVLTAKHVHILSHAIYDAYTLGAIFRGNPLLSVALLDIMALLDMFNP